MPVVIERLKIRGFRGYAAEQSFTFENPVVVLFGENHVGKSSTLNAVDWCLFGSDCAGAATGIRERVDWEIPNRNIGTVDVLVELGLQTPDGTLSIRRLLKRRPKRQGLVEELEATLPDGTKCVGEEAKSTVYNVVRSSFMDFSTTVYLHQEVIRNILTQVPSERNKAIDMLLGLSDYRELLKGVDSAGVAGKHRQVATSFNDFQNEIARALDLRQRDTKQKQAEAAAAGLSGPDLSPEGALRLATEVVQNLSSFAAEAGIAWARITEPSDWHALAAFEKSMKKEITRLRGEVPEVKEQAELFARRGNVANLAGRYEAAQTAHSNAASALRDFEKDHGKREAIWSELEGNRTRIKGLRAKLEETNAKSLLVKDGIEYLRKADVSALGGRCPLCGNHAADLLDHLQREWSQEIKVQVEAIQDEVEASQDEGKRLQGLLAKSDDLDGALKLARESLRELLPETSAIVVREITSSNDLLAILNQELGEIGQRLGALRTAIEQKQVRLNNVESRLGSTALVAEILALEERGRSIENIRQAAEYRELEDVRDQFARWVDDVEKVKEAIKSASNDEARAKIASAEKVIDEFFRKLTNHPSVKKVRLVVTTDARTGMNSYDFRGADDRDISPILSQGDLNALALAIFLGLASTAGDGERLGFVILDDPSQSLGTHHKTQLAEVLNDVSQRKQQTIISTMDPELRELMEARLIKAKTTYHFTGWDGPGGPHLGG
jgi:DNA repair exonuclease SbcCD ATPase subunit